MFKELMVILDNIHKEHIDSIKRAYVNSALEDDRFVEWLDNRDVKQGLDDNWYDCDGPLLKENMYILLLDWEKEVENE